MEDLYKQIKKLLIHPLRIYPAKGTSEEHKKYIIKPIRTGFKRPKDSYCVEHFSVKITPIHVDRTWVITFNENSIDANDPCIIANFAIAAWQEFLDNIPVEHELIFPILDKLKDVTLQWAPRPKSSWSSIAVQLVTIKKKRVVDHFYEYWSCIDIHLNKDDAIYQINGNVFRFHDAEFDKKMYKCILAIFKKCRPTHRINIPKRNPWI